MRACLLLLLVAIAGLPACGSSGQEAAKASGQVAASASSSATGAGGAASSSTASAGGANGSAAAVAYPAPHPSMPQIPKGPGDVLHDPVITTVTWPNDELAASLETFDDAIGATAWWSATASEYGVGAAKGGDHVHLTEAAPAAITDAQIQDWLIGKVADMTLTPTDQTIFALYFPDPTVITLAGPGGGRSCEAFAGYHSITYAPGEASTTPIVYAVLPRCSGMLNDLTVPASHELNEASTDPRPGIQQQAFDLLMADAWNPAGGESADLCEFVSATTEGMYSVTRVWSNHAAELGEQPCVPTPPDSVPYFNAGIVSETLTAQPGDVVTTDVDCYSFGPLPNAMTLSVETNTTSILSFSLDRSTCVNGDVAKLSIAVDASAAARTDYLYVLVSTVDANHQHIWRGMVSVSP